MSGVTKEQVGIQRFVSNILTEIFIQCSESYSVSGVITGVPEYSSPGVTRRLVKDDERGVPERHMSRSTTFRERSLHTSERGTLSLVEESGQD